MGRATDFVKESVAGFGISIHALRGEGDNDSTRPCLSSRISIHALRGEGDGSGGFGRQYTAQFQSTPSVGRATLTNDLNTQKTKYISIHALRGEGDWLIY